MAILRLIKSSDKHCNNNCIYCFANRHDYEKPVFDDCMQKDMIYVIYPNCDGEIDIDNYIKHFHKKYPHHNRNKIVIAFSTKNSLPNKTLEFLSKLNQSFMVDNIGFVKIAVTITSKTYNNLIEPNASSYKERLTTLEKIRATGIETAVAFKPIIPFVNIDEYYEIMRDVRPFTDRILIGGLYVEKKSSFYKKYLLEYKTTKRHVTWLPECPVWSYIDSSEKQNAIKKYSLKLNLSVFESDIDLIKNICFIKGWGKLI